jgi:hypothetical protein
VQTVYCVMTSRELLEALCRLLPMSGSDNFGVRRDEEKPKEHQKQRSWPPAAWE